MELATYLSARGATAQLARRLGVSASLVTQWGRGKLVPKTRCAQVERATAGVVTTEDLRRDVRWIRISDPDWPHPDGRPCIDVAAPASRGPAVVLTPEGQAAADVAVAEAKARRARELGVAR